MRVEKPVATKTYTTAQERDMMWSVLDKIAMDHPSPVGIAQEVLKKLKLGWGQP